MPFVKKPAPSLADNLSVAADLATGVIDTFEEMVLDLYNSSFVADDVAAQAEAEIARLTELRDTARATAHRNETVIANIRALTGASYILGKA